MQTLDRIDKVRLSVVVGAIVVMTAAIIGGMIAFSHSSLGARSAPIAAAPEMYAGLSPHRPVAGRYSAGTCTRFHFRLSDLRPSAAADRSAAAIFDSLKGSGCTA